MPIETDSDVWEDAEERSPTRQRVLEFLQEHSDKAFHIRELADEIVDTDWEAGHEQERLIQKVGEDEFFENREKYEGQLGEVQESTAWDQIITNYLRSQLAALIEEGKVETRNVPAEKSDIPYDWDTVVYYTSK